MTRTLASLILLGVAALCGVVLATLRRRERPIPVSVALLHGIATLCGLGTLLSFVLALVEIAGSGALLGFMPLALALCVSAALGGVVLLTYHARRQPLPRTLVNGQALVGILAFASLLLGVVTGK